MRTTIFALILWFAVAGQAFAAVADPLYPAQELKPAELQGRSLRELELMRATILGHAGLMFRNPGLRAYFSREPWYKGSVQAVARKRLSPVDAANLRAIVRYESELDRDALVRRRDALGKQYPIGTIARVRDIALSPDGTMAAVAEDAAVRLWQVPGGGWVRDLEAAMPLAVRALGFVPSGAAIWLVTDDGRFGLWAVETGKVQSTVVLPIKLDDKARAAVSPDAKRLALWDGAVLHFWDPAMKKEVWKQPVKGAVRAIGFVPDGKSLFVLSASELTRYDVVNGRIIVSGPAQGPLATATVMTVSDDGSQLVLGGAGWLASLNLGSGQLVGTEEQRADAAQEEKFHVAVRPGNTTILAAGQPGRIFLAEQGKSEPVWQRRLSERPFKERFAVALSRDGKYVLVGTPDVAATGWDLELWDAEQGVPVAGFSGPAQARVERRLVQRALGEKVELEGAGAATPLDDPDLLDQALTKEKLQDFSRRELRTLRALIYARRGRPFKSELLKRVFERMAWYKANPGYRDTQLTPVDRKNLALLREAEKAFAVRGEAPPKAGDEESWYAAGD